MPGDGRYRLAALLRVREEAERCGAAALAVALSTLEREEAELSRRDARFRERGREAAGAARAPPGRSAEALQWRARALCRARGELRELANRLDAQRVRVEEARQAAERARAALTVARAQRRGMEMHRERWVGERRAARQAALDAEQEGLARAGGAAGRSGSA